MCYKIVGIVKEISWKIDKAVLLPHLIKLVPDSEYVLKQGGKNIVVLRHTSGNSTKGEAKFYEYKAYITILIEQNPMQLQIPMISSKKMSFYFDDKSDGNTQTGDEDKILVSLYRDEQEDKTEQENKGEQGKTTEQGKKPMPENKGEFFLSHISIFP